MFRIINVRGYFNPTNPIQARTKNLNQTLILENPGP